MTASGNKPTKKCVITHDSCSHAAVVRDFIALGGAFRRSASTRS